MFISKLESPESRRNHSLTSKSRFKNPKIHQVVMYYTPAHLCPGMCSTSLLTIFWKNFLGQSDCTTSGYQHIFQYDGTFRWKLYFGIFGIGHVFCTIIWNMGAILWLNAWSLRMTWGWSAASGIE